MFNNIIYIFFVVIDVLSMRKCLLDVILYIFYYIFRLKIFLDYYLFFFRIILDWNYYCCFVISKIILLGCFSIIIGVF